MLIAPIFYNPTVGLFNTGNKYDVRECIKNQTYYIIYWKISKTVDLKSYHPKKKIVTVKQWMLARLIVVINHFTLYINIKLLYCIPKTNIMLYVSNVSI